MTENRRACAPSNLTRFLDQRAPQMAAAVARADLRRSRERFEHFLEKAFASPDLLARARRRSGAGGTVIDIFEHSQYFADQLIRHPELVFELEPAGAGAVPSPAERARTPARCGAPSAARCCASRARAFCGKVPIFHDAGADLRPGRRGDRGGLPDRAAERLRRTRPASAAYTPARPDDGDRAGPAGHARIRSGLRRRPDLRDSGRRRVRAGLLDARCRAHDRRDHLLHRRRRDFHGGYAAASERPRGRAGADGELLQGLFRASTPRPGKASPT